MSAEWESRDRERFGPSLSVVAGMSFGPLCRRSLVALLLVVSTALFPVSLTAAGEDVRSLLEALRIDIPAQPLAAPAFSLPDLNGTPVRLADFRGRIVMLYFWTTW